AGAPEQRVIGLVERAHPADFINEPQLQMILQILAHPRLIEYTRQAELAQLRPRTHAGQKQQLRRSKRASCENHFAAGARTATCTVLPPAHAGRALAVEIDAFHQATGLEPQVSPLEHRLEETTRCGPAPPEFLVDVEVARALVVAGVEVVDRL